MQSLMVLFLPITYPIARALDYALGREMETAYNKKQLDKLLEIHMAEEAINTDDRQARP